MVRFKLAYQPFPEFIRGRVRGSTMISNGRCMIIIDRDLDEAGRRRYLKHEFAHILLGHFDDPRAKDSSSYLWNLAEIEEEADRYADQMTDAEFSELMTYQIGETIYA